MTAFRHTPGSPVIETNDGLLMPSRIEDYEEGDELRWIATWELGEGKHLDASLGEWSDGTFSLVLGCDDVIGSVQETNDGRIICRHTPYPPGAEAEALLRDIFPPEGRQLASRRPCCRADVVEQLRRWGDMTVEVV